MKPIPSALAAPWAIEPHWLRVVFGVWSRGQLDAQALQQARAEWQARQAAKPTADEQSAPIEGTGGTLRIIGNVGVLGIEGPLFRHANIITDFSGGTTYDALWRGLEAALSSNQVQGILLRVNSPGGACDGLAELAKGLRAAGERKLVWTYADNMMASASYWLGIQSAHVVAEETAELGSIGVRCGLLDDSKADEMEGYRQIEVISSVSPGKRSRPVDDDVVGRLQTRVDDLAMLFVESVAEARGVDPEVVLADFGQGDVLIASKALAAGMADEIGNFNGTLAALAAAAMTSTPEALAAARANRGANMSTKNPGSSSTAPRADADGGSEWKCKGCNEMLGSSADAFCTKCATEDDGEEPDGDEDEEAKALATVGLLGKKKSDTRKKLFAFASSVIEATGTKTASAAIVSVLANAKAGSDLEAYRVEAEKQAGAARAKTVGDKLAAAIAGGKIPLGMVSKEVALLSGAPKVAIKANLAALTKQEASTIVGAITAAPVSEEFAASVDEWLETKGASVALPAPHRPASEADKGALESTKPQLGADGLPVGADLSIAAIQKAAAEKAAAANKGAR